MEHSNHKRFKAATNIKTVKLRARCHQWNTALGEKEMNVLGFYSMNSQYEFTDNLSQLGYLQLPPSRQVQFDLNVNSDKTVKRKLSTNDVKLDSLLKWILLHRPNTMGSPRCVNEIVCFRGLLAKIMCTPYEKLEGWIICATKFQGRIYLCKYDTPEKVLAEGARTPRDKQMCDWGYVFEQYTVSESPDSAPNMSKPTNQNEEFSFVFQRSIGDHRLFLAAEMDALKLDEKGCNVGVGNDAEKLKTLLKTGRAKFVELKTSLDATTSEWEWRKVCRFKSLRWWTQCIIASVQEVVVGYRTKEGIVRKIETFSVNSLPELGRDYWDPNNCVQYVINFLDMVSEQVSSASDEVMWKFTWKPEQYDNVIVEQIDQNSPYFFLHKWYTDGHASDGHAKTGTSQTSGGEECN